MRRGERDGARPAGMHSDIWSRVRRVVGRDRSSGDLSVCVDLAFWAVFRVSMAVPDRVA